MQEPRETSQHLIEVQEEKIPLCGRWRSKYDIQMDAKGRISLPAQWREAGNYALGLVKEYGVNVNQSLYIIEHLRYPAIQVFNLKAWNWRTDLLMSQSPLDKGVAIFQSQVFGAQSTTIRKDEKRMTLLIDKIRRAHAGLEPGKAVTLTGNLDHFQVWHPDTYQKFMKDPNFEEAANPPVSEALLKAIRL